jgi:glycosyltransferase involved in cell wall biosynthesis
MGTCSIVPDHQAADRLDDDAIMIVRTDDPEALARRLITAATESLPERQITRTWATRRRWGRAVSDRRHLHDELCDDSASRKLRVVYLGHVAQLSGGEIALVRLIEALREVDAHVILAEDGPLVERLHAVNASVEILRLRERTRDLRKDRVTATRLPFSAALDTALYVLRLARRVRAIRPDLIHTNTLKAGVYGSLAGRLVGIPVVWHVRDRIADDYLRRPAAALVRGLIATLPSGVIVNSETTGKTLWRKRARASTIPSLIPDTIGDPPLRWRASGDRFVVGMVGRIAPWKGQHIFLDAFANAFGSGDEVAIIVGAPMFGVAETEYETQLRQQATASGLSDRIIFRGFRSDVWRELAEMDIFVHASVTPEPFGQVIVEAMHAGVPVIATVGGGPSEIVTDGTDGLLCPPGDIDSLARMLRQLRDDPGLRSRLVENARRRASDYSPEVVASAVTERYRALLNRGRKRAS